MDCAGVLRACRCLLPAGMAGLFDPCAHRHGMHIHLCDLAEIVEKILFIVCSLMWVAYNLYCGAYVSTVYCVAEIFASAFALARLCKKAGAKNS